MSYRVHEITSPREFAALAPAWDECLESMDVPNPFLTSAWLQAWWEAFGQDYELYVPLVVAEDERLLAAAPLCRHRQSYYGIPLTELCFLGDSTSDRQEFLIRNGRRADGLREHVAKPLATLWDHLRRQVRGITIMRLEQLPMDSPTLAVGRGTNPRLETEPASFLPFVSIDGSWEDFEKSLRKKFRSEMRTRTKVFDSWGSWEFTLRKGTEVEDRLEELIALENRSAKAGQGYAFLCRPENVHFLRGFLARAMPEVEPWLSQLSVSGELVAYLLGFVHGGVYHAYNIAHAPGREKGSPGKWVIHQTIRRCHEAELRGFDFLRGATFIKERWRSQPRRNDRAVWFYAGLRGALLRQAVFRVRPWLKRRQRVSAQEGASDTESLSTDVRGDDN
jgi:CelD/BcsL family acetyltransferase involved in cellulose biosynthesis